MMMREDEGPEVRSVEHNPGYEAVNRQGHKSKPKLHRTHKFRWLVVTVLVLIILGAVGFYYYIRGNSVTLPYPISKQAAQALGFDIYYPNQKLLPPGYTLDKNSFYTTSQTILYTVNDGKTRLVFSDQAKPSAAQIQEFYTKNLPLNTSLSTNVGTATIGAINTQTIISLPTNTNAWLIITAPGNINQQSLNQIIKSIELAK